MLDSIWTPYTGENKGLETTVTSEPSVEPLDVSTVKDFLKIDYSADDSLLNTLITLARRKCEQYSNLSFITQTIQATWQQYGYRVRLPRGPVQSITTVKRLHQDDEVTLTTTDDDYYTSGQDFLTLNMNQMYQDYGKDSYRLKVVYIAGYGDAASDVPGEAIEAVQRTVAWLYEHRGESGLNYSLPMDARALLASIPGAEVIAI